MKETFEQAINNAFINSRLQSIINGDELPEWWPVALNQDMKTIEKILDRFCEDLSVITGRTIRRFTKLRTNPFVADKTPLESAKIAIKSLSNATKNIIRAILSNFPKNSMKDNILTIPIGKIYCIENNARIHTINENERIINYYIRNAKQKEIEIFLNTYFNYNEYAVYNEKYEFVAIKIGNNWPDLIVRNCKTKSKVIKNLSLLSMLLLVLSFVCFSLISVACIWLLEFILLAIGFIGLLFSGIIVFSLGIRLFSILKV